MDKLKQNEKCMKIFSNLSWWFRVFAVYLSPIRITPPCKIHTVEVSVSNVKSINQRGWALLVLMPHTHWRHNLNNVFETRNPKWSVALHCVYIFYLFRPILVDWMSEHLHFILLLMWYATDVWINLLFVATRSFKMLLFVLCACLSIQECAHGVCIRVLQWIEHVWCLCVSGKNGLTPSAIGDFRS